MATNRSTRQSSIPSSTSEATPERVRAAMSRIVGSDIEDEYGIVDEVRELVDLVEELSSDKETAPLAVELAELMIASLAWIIFGFHDAEGDIHDLIHDLEDIHLTATRRLRLDSYKQRELAERLFALQTGFDVALFANAYKTYRGLLGAAGEKRYRELAVTAWEKVPAVTSRSHRYDERTEHLIEIMRMLANESGKVEDIALVRSKRLVSLEDYEQIVQLFRRAEKLKEGAEWAERARKAFPNLAATELRVFLMEAYERLGMHDKLLKLCVDEFRRYPSLQSYEHLRECGQRIGDWTRWRPVLLDAARLPREGSRKGKRADAPHDHSLVVEILLSEKEYDAAWQEAIAGDCSDELWLKLAVAREKSAPEDTRAVYESLVERWIDSGTRYQEAVDLLEAMAKLMRRERREEELEEYLEALRATHRRKRKLMELLDEASL